MIKESIKKNVLGLITAQGTSPIIYSCSEWEEGEESCISSESEMSQTKIRSCFLPLLDTEGMFKRAFAKWVVDQSLPLSIGQLESFKDMIKVANKAICEPDNKELKHMLHLKMVETTERLRKYIQEKTFSVTVDYWTSLANENYGTLTLHIIDDFRLVSFVVSCVKHEDGAMAEGMESQLTSDLQSCWGLNAEFFIPLVSDSTSNMNALGRMIKEKYLTKHHYCADHTVHYN